MKLYRMEHPKSLKGPWTHRPQMWHPSRVALPFASYKDGRWGTYLPGPVSDGIPSAFHESDGREKYVCGAATLKKLLRWFPALYRRSMASHGFVIREMEVPEEAILGHGRWQVAFERKHPGVRVLDEHPPARTVVARSYPRYGTLKDRALGVTAL